jgi:hypothetical protein
MTSRPPSNQDQYSLEAPPLDQRNAQVISEQVQSQLAASGWQGREGGPGMALAQLFGRMAELIIARLNRAPEKHFLAFLNEASIDLLAPRPASAELTFTLPDDYQGLVRVPAGTQVATVQTETQPEVIFETQQDINVVPTSLIKCVAFDPVNYSDYTAQARGNAPGPFAAFQGQQERERILYLGDDELLAFPDEASRQATAITLHFQFASPGNPTSDGWRLDWLYWDGTNWARLENAGATITDHTSNFSQDGEVELKNLPELAEAEVEGQSGLWIACQLTGGNARNYLPALSNVEISRRVEIEATQITADAALSAIHSGTAFVPLDPGGEFFPLGQRLGRLDTFYLRADEAFTKGGASVEIAIDLEGVPERDRLQRISELEALDRPVGIL